VLVKWFGAGTGSLADWGLMLVTLVIVMGMCAGLNITSERVAYRRLRRRPSSPRSSPRSASASSSSGSACCSTVVAEELAEGDPGRRTRAGPVTIDWSTIIVIAVTSPPAHPVLHRSAHPAGQGHARDAQDQDAPG